MFAWIVVAATLPARPPSLSVVVDTKTGVWRGILVNGKTYGEPTADMNLVYEGGQLPPPTEWKLLGLERSGPTTLVTRQVGAWTLTTATTVQGTTITRRAKIRWDGNSRVLVTGLALRSPALRFSSEGRDWALVPGNFPIRKIPDAGMGPLLSVKEAGWTRAEYSLGVLHSPVARLSVAAAYRFTHDRARLTIIRTGQGFVFDHAFEAPAWLQPGETLEVGEQVFQVIAGDEAALRRGVQRLMNSIGNGPPPDQPDDLGRTVLCQVHPWGRLESWGDGDRGNRYDRLTALVPYYRRLGVNTLWLMPVSWPPPWVYTLPAFDRIAPENGSPEQLETFIRTAHAAGLRVLIDLVVYGIHPDSEEVQRLPDEVWCKDRQGKKVPVWGGTVLAADTSNRIWQERIRQVVRRWATEFGFDGARLDCIGWGQAPNWASPRPNAAVAFGGLELNKVVRDAFRSVHRHAVTLPEGGIPLVFKNADMIFDYPLYMAMREITQRPDLVQWITDIRAWLEWERLAYPQRGLRGLVHFLELHDTVSATDYFGVGPSQALMAVLVFMQGVPLLQQEQEIGYSEDLRRWITLRNSERCFTHGAAHYEAVNASDGRVLAFLREAQDGAAVVAVNPTGDPLPCTLRWPATLSARFSSAWDGLAGKRLATSGALVSMTIPPYRPVVILLKPAGWQPSTAPQEKLAGRRWTVRTSEGTLTDIEQDYATKLRTGETLADALPTLRRAQRAEELGLMDGVLPPEIRGGPVKVEIDPWFVRMDNGRVRLTLARRHGGVPARLEMHAGQRHVQVFTEGADAYADQGFFASNLYASADGETNPRLRFGRDGDRVIAIFSGTLRQRAWNGVQSCPAPAPTVRYALRYAMGADARVDVTMTLRSDVDRPAAPSWFYALRMPMHDFAGWQRGTEAGLAGASLGARLGHAGASSEPLVLSTNTTHVRVLPGHGLARAFGIDSGQGRCHLFLALADGSMKAPQANEELTAEATLEILPLEGAAR